MVHFERTGKYLKIRNEIGLVEGVYEGKDS